MAATAVRIKAGSTTLTFDENGTDGKLVRYDPSMPREKLQRHQRQIADGDEIVAFSYSNPRERIKVLVEGTYSQIQAVFAMFNKLAEQARRNAEYGADLEDEVFLEVLPETESDWYRSRIFTFTPHMEADLLDLHIDNQKMMFELEMIREYFFEHATEQTLYLSNTATERTQSAVTVYNSNDGNAGARYNWVQILNSDIDGDLPAPVRMEMENTYNDVDNTVDVWYGLDFRSADPDGIALGLLVNDELLGSTQPGSPNYSLYEEGQYQENTFTDDNLTKIAHWNLTQAFLDDAAGNFYRVLMRMPNGPDHTDWRMKVEFDMGGSMVLWSSGLQPIGENDIVDFGVVQLPPFVPHISVYISNFFVYAQRPSGSSGTWTSRIDWVKFFPVDSWGIMRNAGYQLSYQDTLVDDAIKDQQYMDPNILGGGAVPSYLRYGTGVWVTPHKDEAAGNVHRVYFAWEDEDGLADPAATLAVNMYYRPRRLFL